MSVIYKISIVSLSSLLLQSCVSYDRAACLTLSRNVNSYFFGEHLGVSFTPLKSSVLECKDALQQQKTKPESLVEGILEVEQCLSHKGWALTQDMRVRKKRC